MQGENSPCVANCTILTGVYWGVVSFPRPLTKKRFCTRAEGFFGGGRPHARRRAGSPSGRLY